MDPLSDLSRAVARSGVCLITKFERKLGKFSDMISSFDVNSDGLVGHLSKQFQVRKMDDYDMKR
jgi:hypothetical protein